MRLDLLVVAAMRLASRGPTGRGQVRLHVLVVAAMLLASRRQTGWGQVRLDFLFLWLWLILLTSLVRHYSSFRNFAVDSLDAFSAPNLPWFASKTQSAL